ncbi:hypothetical protein CANINC_000670 [Pichia inconspicua]|uniref:Oligomycin resistance ATP-dependent permease YOR1 n=1 Tax=Pichia inconspicua TaxID=52247 RepID=A0A4T0X7B1_9ASCO|nr:hypothetical protein CANINC_000670 [[Candida] inconspicua]
MSIRGESNLESQNPVSLERQRRLLSFLMSKNVPPVPTDEERTVYPEFSANILSRIMFWWLNPIMKLGYKRTLTDNDLFKLEEHQENDHMYKKFRTIFDAKYNKALKAFLIEKFKDENRPFDENTILEEYHPDDVVDFRLPATILPLSLFQTLKVQYTFGCTLKIASDVVAVTTPLLQKRLVEFVAKKTLGFEHNMGQGVGFAIGVCFMILFTSLSMNHAFYYFMISGAKVRGVLTRMLLDKSLSVGARGVHRFPASTVQSMISTDLNRIDFAIAFFPFSFTSIIPIAITIGLLIWNIGVSSLVGLSIFIAILFFVGGFISQLIGLREKASFFTEKRVNLMKEVLKNFKMIKFYSWEKSYESRIQNARNSEMKYVLKLQGLRNVLISMAYAMPVLGSMATFCTVYDITDGKSAAAIFSSLSFFQVLSIQFMMVPMSVSLTSDMIVGLRKMSDYLSCADINHEQFKIEEYKEDQEDKDGDYCFKIENGDFEWETFSDDESDDDDDQDNVSLPENKKKGLLSKLMRKKNIHKDAEFMKEKAKLIRKKPKKMDTGLKSDIPSSLSSTEKMHEVQKTSFPGLHNINFKIKKGEFVVVTGSIGSGKSSLLDAMAGLMKRVNGHVYSRGKLLLCGYPWVQNATIRDNILFGLPYDVEKYEKIVHACCLADDFNQFEGGDMTEVGERGITLSGGQKARINLARAIYADPDIILLDDVLSAVDAKVGRHIVEHCILGLLKDKTRIMATHQLSLIDSADRMIFLNGDGTIDVGTIDKLLERNTKFINLLNYNAKKEEEILEEEQLDMDKPGSNGDLLKKHETLMKPEFGEDSENYTSPPKEHDVVRIIGDEERAVNSLKFEVYYHYIKLAVGKLGLISLLLFAFLLTIATFSEIFTNTWLSFWVELKFDGRSKSFYMGIYIMFSFLYAILLSVTFYIITYYCNESARLLNYLAATKILHVPVAFMDISPVGRVLNRFTKDTDTLDNEISEQIRQGVNYFATVLGTVILCIVYIPWFAIAIPLMVIAYSGIAIYYQASAREIKRLEAVKRSFVYSHFNEILSGKDVIKAYHLIQRVKEKLNKLIDSQNEAYFITIANQRWIGANLSVVSFFIVFVISFLCIFSVFSISAASTGLLLTYVMNMTGIMNMLVRAMTQVENEFNSVERLNYYAYDIIQEPPYEIPEIDDSPELQYWPQNGEISIKHLYLKYRPELPFVLKDVNLAIKPSEKVGFCGRTGSGKSTLMTSLYRFTEFEGSILIDGVDINKLGLHKLRSKLTVIPQDPVLFIGTIRENLDPFNEQSDDLLWDSLCIAGLIKKEDLPTVKNQLDDDENLHKFHLNRTVEDDGTNFSIGERQLIALARALVRKSKILILDEATSSVDYETDSKIQHTIATEFKECTILCIAHRLNTILNYDRIAVLDAGEVVEFDKPKVLFQKEGGFFRSMCDQAKITIEDFD